MEKSSLRYELNVSTLLLDTSFISLSPLLKKSCRCCQGRVRYYGLGGLPGAPEARCGQHANRPNPVARDIQVLHTGHFRPRPPRLTTPRGVDHVIADHEVRQVTALNHLRPPTGLRLVKPTLKLLPVRHRVLWRKRIKI